MAHQSQIDYCQSVKKKFPIFFINRRVLDAGSLHVNGDNRYLFTNCQYIGIDVGKGKNVDIVSKIHEYDADDGSFDVIISTECFEHDMYYESSLKNIVRMLKSGGLFLFTCATTGRPEHGTRRVNGQDAPLLTQWNASEVYGIDKKWGYYYKNITENDVCKAINVKSIFSKYQFTVDDNHKDLQFWGIKK